MYIVASGDLLSRLRQWMFQSWLGAAFPDLMIPTPFKRRLNRRNEILITTKGDFDADLTRLVFPRLWTQGGRESLPRIANSTVSLDCPPIFFLADAAQAPIRHCGRDLAFGELVVAGPGSTHHHQTGAPCRWTTMSLTRDDLAAASIALVDINLATPSNSHRLRPPPKLMSRLLNLHRAAEKLAAHSPDVLAQPEAERTLEHALVHAMIMCLNASEPINMNAGTLRHTAIIVRAINASERTLRVSSVQISATRRGAVLRKVYSIASLARSVRLT